MNRKKQIKNLDYMKPYRKGLRKRLTPAEASLWLLLKNKNAFGLKFRRQASIGNYVVDFYCPRLKMIIELDGEPHFTQEQADKDQKRDKRLKELGYKVFRYENQVVFDHPDFIFDDIKRLIPPPPSKTDSPPKNRRGAGRCIDAFNLQKCGSSFSPVFRGDAEGRGV